MAVDKQKRAAYMREYYSRPGKTERRRGQENSRYATDSAYREMVKLKSRERYHKLKAAGTLTRNRLADSARRLERKRIVMEAYGGKCNCCGESGLHFLTLDHINNDGWQHRKILGERDGYSYFYQWVIKNNFPKDILQVLCWNCNSGKRVNKGVCPHAQQSPDGGGPVRPLPE